MCPWPATVLSLARRARATLLSSASPWPSPPLAAVPRAARMCSRMREEKLMMHLSCPFSTSPTTKRPVW
eukprot:g19750.t1